MRFFFCLAFLPVYYKPDGFVAVTWHLRKKKKKKRIGQTLSKNAVVPVHLISTHLESPIIKLSIYNPRVIISSLDGIVSLLTSSNESIQKLSLLKWNARARLTECNIKFPPWLVARNRNSKFFWQESCLSLVTTMCCCLIGLHDFA